MPEMKDKTVKGLIAYADFTFADKAYKAGEIFALPAGMVRDAAFDEFRAIEKKNAEEGQQIGLAFTTKEGKRVILPLQEA
jgi:hypothetical protein